MKLQTPLTLLPSLQASSKGCKSCEGLGHRPQTVEQNEGLNPEFEYQFLYIRYVNSVSSLNLSEMMLSACKNNSNDTYLIRLM